MLRYRTRVSQFLRTDIRSRVAIRPLRDWGDA